MNVEKLFARYKARVDKGDYKSHSEMIRKYRKLLERIEIHSPLAQQILAEIDAHETDDRMDKAGW